MNNNLIKFIGYSQGEAMKETLKGEEEKFFTRKFCDLYDTICKMPKTYETDGQGDNAIAHLHYFKGDSDWWITEKDTEDDQIQAFGLACLNGDSQNAEMGYINIDELIKHGIELDLYWEPKTIEEIKKRIRLIKMTNTFTTIATESKENKMEKQGFKHEGKDIYYIDARGKDASFDRWRVCLYYHPGMAKTYFLQSEKEYNDFIELHQKECYADYSDYRKEWESFNCEYQSGYQEPIVRWR